MDSWKIKQVIDIEKVDKSTTGYPYMIATQGDRSAHVWEITVMRGKDPADLSGAMATASFIRADGATVDVSGSITGNCASVVLPQEVYAYPGRVIGLFSLRAGEEKALTASAISFDVRAGSTETIIVPGSPVQDIEDLMAYIDQLEALRDDLTGVETRLNAKVDGYEAHVNEVDSRLSESIDEIESEIYTKSKNIFNGKSSGIEVGFYNSSGVFNNTSSTALQMHTSEYIKVEEGERYVLNALEFASSEYTFLYLVQFNSDKSYIAGSYQNVTRAMLTAAPHYIPFVAAGKYIRVSYQIASVVEEKLQIEKGTTGTDFEPYGKKLKVVNTVDDNLSDTSENPVQNKVVAKAISEMGTGIDYSVFTLPYIKGGKVLTNTKVAYAAIKDEEIIDRIDCKYVWEEGAESAALALIFTENNRSIDDIVSHPSLHLVVSASKIKLDIFGAYASTGSNIYQTLIDQTFPTPQALDGETEHTVLFYVSKNSSGAYTGKVNVTVDGVNYSANIDTSKEPFLSVVQGGLSGMNMHSAWFEYYTTNADRWAVCMPMITYFAAQKYAAGKWGDLMRDYFDRQDGQLTCDAYGHSYILINSTTGYKR